MGLKIFTIILILFVAEITFLSTKEPKELQVTKEDINFSTIEFSGVQGSSIDKDGISQTIIASKVLKFKTHDELYDINTSFQKKGLVHTLLSQKAHYHDNILRLSKKVQYENNQSMQIKSEELEYNTKTKIVKSPSSFEMTSPKGVALGDAFVYDMLANKFKGEKMKYSFEVDEK